MPIVTQALLMSTSMSGHAITCGSRRRLTRLDHVDTGDIGLTNRLRRVLGLTTDGKFKSTPFSAEHLSDLSLFLVEKVLMLNVDEDANGVRPNDHNACWNVSVQTASA
jgi:hypothetical protein